MFIKLKIILRLTNTKLIYPLIGHIYLNGFNERAI